MYTAMQEPAYILKNGQSVSYIPLEVKTARDAYAASLHVLFKHVADFHICIVKTFSAKYGIPEDDILKTIQESEEFKNMQVDPVLDMGMQSLGYLDEV
jgi:1-aminocyclopropane-1-carboxylate deaminase/D-cysteine desulfhydrase-like pyridoxal-dependent ACC family enzyme